MPDYCFFLSYASEDRIKGDRRNDRVHSFFEDLNQAVKGLGFPDGGFFDRDGLQGKWKDDLREALASSRVLVPLYSPNYFRGPYCGREWEVFNLRFEENERRRYTDVTGSKVIVPVHWKPRVVYPEKVKEYQINYDRCPAVYQERGLEHMVHLKRNTQTYWNFVQDFAGQLQLVAESQGAAKVRDVPDWDSLNPPFPGQNPAGLNFVRYVFVTGLKLQMSRLRAASESYPTFVDRRDWRPCYPDVDRPVDGIVTAPARADNRSYEFLDPSPQTLERLREARRLRNVIVIVVDPWCVKLPELIRFLDDFDKEEFPNSAVLVNWNGKDQETTQQTDTLRRLLEDRFKGRLARQEFHKDPVSSPETLADAVREAFGAVQGRLVESSLLRPAGDAGNSAPAPIIRN